MSPTDIRALVWADIQGRLEGDREAIYRNLLHFGPCTTRGLASRMDMDPFSVRPRVTELCQLGLSRLQQRSGREGIYEAITIDEARRAFERRRRGEPEQLTMGI